MDSFQAKLANWIKNSFRREIPSNSFKCGTCGKVHIGLPMDMAYKNPGGYFEVPAKERAARIYNNDDVCVIDDSKFYIRGILPIPIVDSDDEFRWGLWAKVEESDFKIYSEYWDGNIPEDLPPLNGHLSGEMKDYPESDMTPIKIYLQSDNQRPFFKVLSNDSQLGIDQRKGITMEKVHSFVEPLLK
jgi:hypothetical protein